MKSYITIQKGAKNRSPSPLALRIICVVNKIEVMIGKQEYLKPFFEKLRNGIQASLSVNCFKKIFPEKPLWTNEDQEFLSNLAGKRQFTSKKADI